MKNLWKNVKGKLANTWKFLDGKKTFIGGAIYFGTMAVNAWNPELLNSAQSTFLTSTGEGLMGVGILSRAFSSKTAINAVKRAQKMTKRNSNSAM